jgi:hypothetical protein
MMRRRARMAHKSQLLVLPDGHYPNRIRRLLKLPGKPLCADWHVRRVVGLRFELSVGPGW